MFPRELDDHQIFFAIGEALAHLHYLMHTRKIKRTLSANGTYVFEASELNDQAAKFCKTFERVF